jgi:hypothetical protein
MRSVEDWNADMRSAPYGQPVIILVFDTGHLRPYIGEYRDGGWYVRIPGSSERPLVSPKRWAPIPTVPAFAY